MQCVCLGSIIVLKDLFWAQGFLVVDLNCFFFVVILRLNWPKLLAYFVLQEALEMTGNTELKRLRFYAAGPKMSGFSGKRNVEVTCKGIKKKTVISVSFYLY